MTADEALSHVFSAKVPAYRCRRCGEVYFEGPALEQFELLVAVVLAKAGGAFAAPLPLISRLPDGSTRAT